MKVIQPFLLGGVGGLAVALLIALGLFASPLRKGLYLDWDPEIQLLKEKLEGQKEKLVSVELGIAESGSSRQIDSLKASQAGSWKEYRHWRSRLGELSRMQDRPEPGEFPPWVYSLRFLLGPMALVLFLLPAGLFAARAVRGGSARSARSTRGIPRPASGQGSPKDPGATRNPTAPAESMATLQAAVKQVARIAARNEAPPGGNRQVSEERETEYLPEVPKRIAVPRPAEAAGPAEQGAARPRAYRDALRDETPETPPTPPTPSAAPAQAASPAEAFFQAPEPSPYDVGDAGFRIPETAPLPIPTDEEPRPEGMETQIFNLGPGGWGEARRTSGGGLSMEDEEDAEVSGTGSAGTGSADEEPPPGAFMPPTTEVEKVERRKSEVLKLARKGLTSSEISRRMRISQDQVEFIIRMRREKG